MAVQARLLRRCGRGPKHRPHALTTRSGLIPMRLTRAQRSLALRVLPARPALRVLRAFPVRRERRVRRVIQVHKVRRASRGIQARLGYRAPRARQVPLAQRVQTRQCPVLLALRALLVRLAPQAHKVLRVIRVQPVHKVLRVTRVRLVQLARKDPPVRRDPPVQTAQCQALRVLPVQQAQQAQLVLCLVLPAPRVHRDRRATREQRVRQVHREPLALKVHRESKAQRGQQVLQAHKGHKVCKDLRAQQAHLWSTIRTCLTA